MRKLFCTQCCKPKQILLPSFFCLLIPNWNLIYACMYVCAHQKKLVDNLHKIVTSHPSKIFNSIDIMSSKIHTQTWYVHFNFSCYSWWRLNEYQRFFVKFNKATNCYIKFQLQTMSLEYPASLSYTINRNFCKCFKTDNKTTLNFFIVWKKNVGVFQGKLVWIKFLQKLYAHFANFVYVQNSSPFKSVDYPRLFTE